MAEEGVPGRRGYPADFKQRVVSKLATGDVSLRQLAREFDISVPTLIKWRKEARLSSKARTAAAVAAPAARHERQNPATELERLRLEVEELKQERDRLRQGIAILAGVDYKATS